MVETGVVYRDLGHAPPLPNDASAATRPDTREVSHAISEEPTLSHALADSANHGGHAQQFMKNDDIKDLGWNQDADEIPRPLVGGLPNEELWILIRRFNKVSSSYYSSHEGGAMLCSTAHGCVANVPCQGVSIPGARQP